MSFLDRLFGHAEEPKREEPQRPAAAPASEDELALARYRYMLKTAPPETIEQAHEEAFAKLTPEQRRMVLQQLASEAPEHEKASITAASDDPRSVARVATRAELQRPGVMERVFGGVGGGTGGGFGGGFGGGGMGLGGTLLTSLAAGFAGSMIAQHFFNHTAMGQGFYDSYGGFPGGGNLEGYEHGGRAGADVGAGVADTDDQQTQTLDSGEDSPDESDPQDTDEDTPDDDDSGSDDSGSFDDGGDSDN